MIFVLTMGDIRDTDLNEVYSAEDFLSRNVIERYKSLGIDGILATLRTHPVHAETARENGKDEVILLDGCHKSRALYDLGMHRIPILYEGECELSGKVADEYLKIPDVPILDQAQYDLRYIEQMDEPPGEDWY